MTKRQRRHQELNEMKENKYDKFKINDIYNILMTPTSQI